MNYTERKGQVENAHRAAAAQVQAAQIEMHRLEGEYRLLEILEAELTPETLAVSAQDPQPPTPEQMLAFLTQVKPPNVPATTHLRALQRAQDHAPQDQKPWYGPWGEEPPVEDPVPVQERFPEFFPQEAPAQA